MKCICLSHRRVFLTISYHPHPFLDYALLSSITSMNVSGVAFFSDPAIRMSGPKAVLD